MADMLERTGDGMLTQLLTRHVTLGISSPALGTQRLCQVIVMSLWDLEVDDVETLQIDFSSRRFGE